MTKKEHGRRKARVLPCLLAALFGAAFGATLLAAWEQMCPAPMFQFEADRVSTVRIITRDHAGYIQSQIILDPSDREQIEEIIKLLNEFTYRSAEHIEAKGPIGAGFSCVEVQMGAGYACVYFKSNSDGNPDFVQVWGVDGNSTRYVAESGYFQPLMDRIEEESDSAT